jgi:hypothetical protein
MGKPIAGQDQFPYNTNGFLVDAAKINGVTFSKSLYIYKQRSDTYYDLQDTSGTIYQFVKIVGTDQDKKPLQYFDTSEDIALKLENNTFCMKIQDPTRGIFSFVRLYQWHKCITFDGDYIFRKGGLDPTLSGVYINPVVATISKGSTQSFVATFFPDEYLNTDGNWYLNINGSEKTINTLIKQTDKNKIVVEGIDVGKSILSFIPSGNNSKISSSIINVIDADTPVQSFFGRGTTDLPFSTTRALYGEEFDIVIETYPYDAVLTEALDFDINMNDGLSIDEITLVKVSDDFRTYTFKSKYIYDIDPVGISYNPRITFKMKNPIDFEFMVYSIYIYNEMREIYVKENEELGVRYEVLSNLRPNSQYQAIKQYMYYGIQYNPYISSDPSIATLDHETGLITTYDKTGEVSFSTTYVRDNGEVVNYDNILSFSVIPDVYDYITIDPPNITSVPINSTTQFKIYGVIGDIKTELKIKEVSDSNYKITSDGILTTYNKAGAYATVQVDDLFELSSNVMTPYQTFGAFPLIVEDDKSKYQITDLSSSWVYQNNTVFVNLDGYTAGLIPNFTINPYPEVCVDYELEIISYDESIIEILDKERISENQCFMAGQMIVYFNPVSRGSTLVVVGSVSNPDIKIEVKVVVY